MSAKKTHATDPIPRPPRQGQAGKTYSVRRQKTLAGTIGAIAIAAAVSWLTGYVPTMQPTLESTHQDTQTTHTSAAPSNGRDSAEMSVGEKLADLRVRHDRGAGGYERTAFGEPWADEDGNGCDTRNDILKRDLEDIRFRRGSHCVIQSGILHDPYVGVTINFERGPETSPLVQIDHVVALGDAWRAGASEWTPQERQEFANDMDNLLAVEGQANQDKESSRADQWLPPREEYWCEYVTRQINVKYAWDLTVTEKEKRAMEEALATCP